MPAIRLFHEQYRTMIGGDDIQPTCIITIMVRYIQILLLCIPIVHYSINMILVLHHHTNNSNTTNNNTTITITERHLLDHTIETQSQQQYDNNKNNDYYFYIGITIWIICTIVYNIVSIMIEHQLYYWSNYGTPTTQTSLRNYHIQQCIQYKIFYGSSIILCIIYSIALYSILLYTIIIPYYYYNHPKSSNHSNYDFDTTNDDDIVHNSFSQGHEFSPLRRNLWWIAMFVLLLSQIIESLIAILFLYQLRYTNNYYNNNHTTTEMNTSSSILNQQQLQYQQSHQLQQYNHELIEEMWAKRCASLCHCLSISTCYMFGGRNIQQQQQQLHHHHPYSTSSHNHNNTTHTTTTIFMDIARAMADFLESQNTMDIVPSDIVMGLMIIQRIQRHTIYMARQQYYQHQYHQQQQQHNNAATTSNSNHHTPIEHTDSDTILETMEDGGSITNPIMVSNTKQSRITTLPHTNDNNDTTSTPTTTVLRKRSNSYKNLQSSTPTTTTTATTAIKNIKDYDASKIVSSMDIFLLPPSNIPKDRPSTYIDTTTTTSTTTQYREALHSNGSNVHSDPRYNPTLGRSNTNIYDHNYNTNTTTTNNNIHSVYRMDVDGQYHRMERTVLDITNPMELYLFDEVTRYAKYALAIYTWVLYLYVHPITGPFRLLSYPKLFPKTTTTSSCCYYCCCCCKQNMVHTSSSRQEQYVFVDGTTTPRSATISSTMNRSLMNDDSDENDRQQQHRQQHGGPIDGDNICQTHKHAILLTAGLHDADIVYVQLQSSFSDIPYCILLDHEWKSIVVSIRGTFSLEDCVTDVLITPESLEQLGIDYNFDISCADQYCHGGVMTCANNVYRDLQRHHLLETLLLGDTAIYSNYTLRLVGHSLGAATCTLLSYMLKPKFPSLRCINYSPPGCSFTWNIATQCRDWCTSCVLDTDLVPRLTVESIERLRDEVLELIGRVKVPKSVVVQRFTENTFRFCTDDQHETDSIATDMDMSDILYHPDEVPDTEYQQQLSRFKQIQIQRRQQRGTTRSIQLYPPGRILHIIKTGEKRTCTSGIAKIITCCTTNIGSTYIPVWIDNNDLNEIVVGPRMGTDHFPNRIRAILEEVANNLGL